MADELIETLEEFVTLESPSGDVARLDALRDVLAARFTAAGADVTVHPGPAGDHLDMALPGGDGDPVVVLGHYDTVWPVGRLAEEPFAISDGIATGPGVFDMKAGLAALLWAVRRLDRPLPQPVRIVVTADEEVGSPSGGAVVRAACAGAGAVFALEPPLAEGRLKVGRRGVARILLEVTGRESHAGLDAASGISALDEIVDQLLIVRNELPATPQRSVNVGRVAGGTRANVVAGRAEAELGLRFATEQDEQEVRRVLDALRPERDGARVAVRTLSHRPAWEPSGSLALARHVLAAAERLGERVATGVSGGAGDANITGAMGIPTVDGLGPRGRGAHAPDEAVEVPSILQRARLLRELLSTAVPR